MASPRHPKVALVCLALAVNACTGSGANDPTADPTPTAASPPETSTPSPSPSTTVTPSTTPTPPSPTPTTAHVPDDLSTIADDGEVTVAEAQAVVDVQTAIYNDAVVTLLTRDPSITGGVGASFTDALRRIYRPALRNAWSQVWVQAAQEDFASVNTADPVGIVEVVASVNDVREECFEITVERDTSGISNQPQEVETLKLSLRSENPAPLTNSTGWYRDVQASPDEERPLCDLAPT